jgi:hypothetical protein
MDIAGSVAMVDRLAVQVIPLTAAASGMLMVLVGPSLATMTAPDDC